MIIGNLGSKKYVIFIRNMTKKRKTVRNIGIRILRKDFLLLNLNYANCDIDFLAN